MTLPKIMRLFLGAAFGMLVLVGTPLVAPPVATAGPAQQARVVTYNATRAAEFRDVVDDAARIWNNSVDNVRLEKTTGNADVIIVADDGWPRARTTGLGSGKIWMGREAVNAGHDPTRIAAHEIGHIFGLPDRRTGLCEDLMSGHSAGTECTNAHPNPQEIAEVERNFARGVKLSEQLHVDSLAAVARPANR